MYKMKLLAITAIVIFMAGALTSATAQIRLPPVPVIGPLNGTYKMAVTANVLSAGDAEYAMSETYGWTCYGETTGDLTGFMFVSMNYSLPEYFIQPVDDVIGISPPQPIFQASRITGGSWSKLIFIKGQYVGSVYGRIVGGTMEWSSKDMSAKLILELSADNGTGAFVDNVGKGTFEGLVPSQNTKDGSITGVLTLEY